MDPLLDISQCSSHLPYSRLRCLKVDLQLLHLVDPWRLLHPQERDYSFFSQVHHTYSRLDYLLIIHKDLSRVASTRIDVISLSDHSPVHMTLQLGPVTQNPPSWRLNEILLPSEEVPSELLVVMREYFSINGVSVDNPLVVWEAHKSVIWGTLIKIGARPQRERSRRTDELFTKTHSLECSHKATITQSTYQELLKVLKEHRSLLYHKTKQKLAWVHRTMYKFLNKLGTLLARALRGPFTTTDISDIIGSSGQKLISSTAMVVEFGSFY